MKKFKDWLKKHEKIINTILDIFISFFIFLAGILIGYDYSERKQVNAEPYNPSPPFEYHYRLPIYFTNVICEGELGTYSFPIIGNFYSSADDDVFPYTFLLYDPDLGSYTEQSFYFDGYNDNYARFYSWFSVPFSGVRFVTFVAEDFWFSPDYDFTFQFYNHPSGSIMSLSVHYIIIYEDDDFREHTVSFDYTSNSHNIVTLIDDNINDTSPIFYIRRLSFSFQLNNASGVLCRFDFNGFDNDSYYQIVSDGIGYSNKTYTETRVNWLGSVIDTVNSALQIQLIPSYSTSAGVTIPAFTLGNVLAFVIIIPLIIAVLRLWLGG